MPTRTGVGTDVPEHIRVISSLMSIATCIMQLSSSKFDFLLASMYLAGLFQPWALSGL